ncbi:RHS repeat-associated core domain-containing protein [Streptomyces sp. ms191]|uniref:RHS repeat domain-containing protein n=1 Tax=Streptomyces sp. ms191 TaxID=1827978 RepID=UPI0011CE8C73|nr:RHS repeat-associated core domain-containing protein [Streptomyces sp. ms191]TXS34511.1 RHS repeat-associated core domain-containing protein [Streptomyces sp. ms191]
MAVILSVPIGLTPVAVADGKGGLGRPDLPAQQVTKVKPFRGPATNKARQQVAKDKRNNGLQTERAHADQKHAIWPKPGTANLDLNPSKAQTAAPGGLPVSVAPAAGKGGLQAGTDAAITVLDQGAADKLGITGVVLTAAADNAGKAQISVGYQAFASAIGGDWSGRLQLVQLPGCAVTTPQKAECRKQTPLGSRNHVEKQTVTADVVVAKTDAGIATQLTAGTSGPTVLALTSSGSGQSAKGTGDYSATPLAASSSWSAGGNSGSFTWSYGFTMPPAAAGPTPSLQLSYDSGSIDGRTATTNNQGTAVGEGFSLTESYIERSYGSCDDDGQTDVFDRCWKYDNARLVLNGKSSRLVKTATNGVWKLENDDASQVTRSTGADNGDDDGEYWTVITGDGTKYVFGQNKLPGATTERTNSVWTLPVFGDDSGEPGYSAGSAFATRAVNQAWRWNLDYVEDTRGNAATYGYTKEVEYYKKNKATKADSEYTRGGYLREINYGLRKDANGSLFTDDADAKVTFGYAERCTAADCSSLTKDTAENWPDVPFDSICAKDSTECLAQSPSFFSRKRLTSIDTSSWNATTKVYDPVDSWAFTEEYLDGGDIGDTSDQVLTLKSITRTAKAGTTAIVMDPISFTYQMRPNRVDGTDDILPLTRPRISTVTTETGAITTVTLSAQECIRSQVLGAAQDSNTRNCYPQFWNINGSPDASVDWFHKYRVLGVITTDPAGQNDGVENEYVYTGAAWHHNDDPFTPKDERTWSDWRGYREVTVYKGSRNAPVRTKTVSLYMQGMHGDPNKDGTTKSVSVAKLAQPAIGLATLTDSDQYSGTLREQVTYDGATPISASANYPWSKETARQSGVPDAGDHVARFVRTKKTTSFTYLTATQRWRSSDKDTISFDAKGRAVKVVDNGDLATTGDETCTETWYADNDDLGLTSLISRVRTVEGACTLAEADLKLQNADGTRGNVLSDTATAYDDLTWSDTMKPTKGLATWSGRAETYGATTTWAKIATTSYDALGRPTAVTDADTKTTTTAYTPTATGPLTRTLVTNAAAHKVFNYFDPRRGLTTSTFDPNLKKTELAYDALGRLTDVWLPNRIRGSASPNSSYQYALSNTKQSWVSTSTLKADGATYNTSFAIYDALLRPLQTQSPTPQGGRLLTDIRYDSRGLAYETQSDMFDSAGTPNGTYMRVAYGAAPKQTEIVFDGAERATASTLLVGGVEKWKTTTTYTGDSTATTAVEGGSAGRMIVDARGRTVETREYAGMSPTDAQYGATLGTPYTSTKFEYTPDGKQSGITGPDGAAWSYTYDQYGRQKTATDPDKGRSESEYDAMDRVTKMITGGKSVLSAYDQIGRLTSTWAGGKADGTLLTERTYDTLLKGLPASSTRYVGGKGQTTSKAYTKTVTAYDPLSRPTTTEFSLPTTDALYASVPNGKLSFTSNYRLDGTLGSSTEPALGGLPSEIVQYGYGSVGQLTSVKGLSGYLQYADYSALGQLQQMTLGLGGTGDRNVTLSNTFEAGTGRLTRSNVTDQTHPYMLQDLNYTYDQAGNVTSIADPATLGGTGKAETQCFAYDGHRRLTEAWTPGSQKCSDPRAANTLDGPAPYWTSYTYNQGGQRQQEKQHATGGDTTTHYCYDPANQPHALRYTSTRTEVDCTSAADAVKDKTYAYDPTGNTTKRQGTTGQQDLTWSEEGRLSTLLESGKSTDYVYDADGTLLIRGTQSGERILYAGATELHVRDDGTKWAQRTYTAGTSTLAVRTNQSGTTQVQYLAGDHHGTQSLAITSDSTQKTTKRYMTPFGAERGNSTGNWPTDRGFLDKTTDKQTGLTHIGAREYDPLVGQFISVDPALVLQQHQSLNGYAYANNSPVTASDTTGLWLDDGTGHNEPGGGPGGGQSTTPGVPAGGTGSGGCYYTCSAGGGTAGIGTNGCSPLLCGRGNTVGRGPLIGPEPVSLPYIPSYVASPEYLQARDCAAMPIDLVCNPEEGVFGGGDDGLVEIGAKWALGKLDPSVTYGEDSRVALQAMMTDFTAEQRLKIVRDYVEKGKFEGILKSYSISAGGDESGQFLRDMRSIATGDHNVGTAVLGSYTSEYKILRANSRGIQARITIRNSMSASSFAHVVTGYDTPADRFVKRWVNYDGIVASRVLGSNGMFRAHDMTITFRTEVYF